MLVYVDCSTDGTWALTRVDPFHAVGKHVGAVLGVIGDTQTIGIFHRSVGMEVVSSVAGVCDDSVSLSQAQAQQDQKSSPSWDELLRSHDGRLWTWKWSRSDGDNSETNPTEAKPGASPFCSDAQVDLAREEKDRAHPRPSHGRFSRADRALFEGKHGAPIIRADE